MGAPAVSHEPGINFFQMSEQMFQNDPTTLRLSDSTGTGQQEATDGCLPLLLIRYPCMLLAVVVRLFQTPAACAIAVAARLGSHASEIRGE